MAISKLLVVAVAALLGACGTGAPNRRAADYLDGTTGATITRVDQPFIFFSDDPARAANARDYLSAAPLAVNQGGRRSWWLWLGLWSTIDRGVSVGDAQLANVAGIQLIVDGEPMELDLSALADRIPGVTSLPYASPVATARNILLPLTGSQVVRLSRSANIVVRTDMTSGAARHWQPWIDSGHWTGFAELAAVNADASP